MPPILLSDTGIDWHPVMLPMLQAELTDYSLEFYPPPNAISFSAASAVDAPAIPPREGTASKPAKAKDMILFHVRMLFPP